LQVDILQVDILQVDILQVDILQVDILQVDILQVDILQVDTLQVDTLQSDAKDQRLFLGGFGFWWGVSLRLGGEGPACGVGGCGGSGAAALA
jgi:hypothetical protein